MFADQFDGQGERTGGVRIFIEINLMMHRARFKNVRLQGNADCDALAFLSGVHD